MSTKKTPLGVFFVWQARSTGRPRSQVVYARGARYDDPELIATCRSCDIPYGPDCLTFVIDGFLVSGNVTVQSVRNIDTGFVYSDHNPVVLRFALEP